jgi:hypothetical protein
MHMFGSDTLTIFPKNDVLYVHSEKISNNVRTLSIHCNGYKCKVDMSIFPNTIHTLKIYKYCPFSSYEDIPSFINKIIINDYETPYLELAKFPKSIKHFVFGKRVLVKCNDLVDVSHILSIDTHSSHYLTPHLHKFINLNTLKLTGFASSTITSIPKSVTYLELSFPSYEHNTINNFLDGISFENDSNLETLIISDYFVVLKKGFVPSSVTELKIWSSSKYMSIEVGSIPNTVEDLQLHYSNDRVNLYIESWSSNSYGTSLKTLRENKTDLLEGVIPYGVTNLDLLYHHYENRELEENVLPNSIIELKLSYNMILKLNVIPNSVTSLRFVESIVELLNSPDILPNSITKFSCEDIFDDCMDQFLPESVINVYHKGGVYQRDKKIKTKIKRNDVNCNICFVCDKADEANETKLYNHCNNCKSFMCHFMCCKYQYWYDFKTCPVCYIELVEPVLPPVDPTVVKLSEPISIKDIKIGFRFVPVDYTKENSIVKRLKNIKRKLVGCPFRMYESEKIYLCAPYDYSGREHITRLEINDLKQEINKILKIRCLKVSQDIILSV